jgi:hypothetical protein
LANVAFRLALLAWQELQLKSLVLSLLSFQSRLPSATSLALLPEASLVPFGRTKSFALTFLAAHGLQGLQARFGAQGLHGPQARLAAQGLQGLQALAAAQGLHGLHAFFLVAQGLQAWASTVLRLAAQGLAVLAARATSVGAETVTSPLKTAAHSGLRLRWLGIRGVFMLLSMVKGTTCGLFFLLTAADPRTAANSSLLIHGASLSSG